MGKAVSEIFYMKIGAEGLMTEAQDDLIRTVALACFSYEYEDVDPALAERAWELAIEHAATQGLTPTEAQTQLWHAADQIHYVESSN